MEFVNYDDLITPCDADILILVGYMPEILKDNFYIQRRYSKIIDILNKKTIRNDNIFHDAITIG